MKLLRRKQLRRLIEAIFVLLSYDNHIDISRAVFRRARLIEAIFVLLSYDNHIDTSRAVFQARNHPRKTARLVDVMVSPLKTYVKLLASTIEPKTAVA